MLKILQARLQQYVNRELPDIQAGFRKGRGTRDQIANIHWIMAPVRYSPGNLVGLISSELGVRVSPLPCSTLRCSLGLLVGGRKHSVMLPP